MMKRKISILAVTFLFFASTTGLPLSFHLCKMIENAEADKCIMHNKPVKSSCCEENNSYKVLFSSSNPTCCEIKTIDNSINDSYLIQKLEIKSELVVTHLFLNNDVYNYKSTTNKFFNVTDSSPPSLTDNHLYLTYSSLLI